MEIVSNDAGNLCDFIKGSMLASANATAELNTEVW